MQADEGMCNSAAVAAGSIAAATGSFEEKNATTLLPQCPSCVADLVQEPKILQEFVTDQSKAHSQSHRFTKSKIGLKNKFACSNLKPVVLGLRM